MEKLALLSVMTNAPGGIRHGAREQHGFRLLSTGGTAKLLAEAGLPVTEVSQHTGFPRDHGGTRENTHPKIHGGLLCRRDNSRPPGGRRRRTASR